MFVLEVGGLMLGAWGVLVDVMIGAGVILGGGFRFGDGWGGVIIVGILMVIV